MLKIVNKENAQGCINEASAYMQSFVRTKMTQVKRLRVKSIVGYNPS